MNVCTQSVEEILNCFRKTRKVSTCMHTLASLDMIGFEMKLNTPREYSGGPMVSNLSGPT